jgi:predicted RNA-binding Zn-ribbon protein involved in translation (DUF1610 family)
MAILASAAIFCALVFGSTQWGREANNQYRLNYGYCYLVPNATGDQSIEMTWIGDTAIYFVYGEVAIKSFWQLEPASKNEPAEGLLQYIHNVSALTQRFEEMYTTAFSSDRKLFDSHGFYFGFARPDEIRYGVVVGSWELGAPLPAALCFFGILPAFSIFRRTMHLLRWLRARHRLSKQRCPNCGYSLVGLTGRCPECGYKAARTQAWRKSEASA